MIAAIDFHPSRNQRPVAGLPTSALSEPDDSPKPRRISLFGIPFGLLLILLVISTLASYWQLRMIDEEPHMRASARQIVSIVMLTRATLMYANPEQRSQIETLMAQERIHIIPRTSADRIQPFHDDHAAQYLATALHGRLGINTEIARSVNARPGLWVGFTVGSDNWWLYFDRVPINQDIGGNI